MTLRVRLVAGLVLLMATGLAVFGVSAYRLYARSQYRQVDQQLDAAVPLVTEELSFVADSQTSTGGAGPPPGGAVEGAPAGDPGGGYQRSPVLVAPGTYGELVSSSGSVLSHIQQVGASSQPDLTDQMTSGSSARLVTVDSVNGSTRWRVYIGPAQSDGDRVVVAMPLTSLDSSLEHLMLIEISGAAILLLILSTGAVLMLRRGLAPLERMAQTASVIAAGDLSERAEAADPRTEVGQLGAAFNSMLDGIQMAFAERDATEARLRQFLADASHELRTPLTSIQGFAELFRLQLGDPESDPATIVRRIEQESARMRSLVEDLLLLARLDEVRNADVQPVDLTVLAADACTDTIAVAPERPVTLTAPSPVIVTGDERHLRQAIANLTGNALKHTPPGTPIEVSVRADGPQAIVEVRDHGSGLDDDGLAHAFDRFWQGDPARVGAGAGLGLSIVAAVMAEHGGRVGVANAADGGSVFSLHLCL